MSRSRRVPVRPTDRRVVAALLAAALLSGCTSGSGGSDPTPAASGSVPSGGASATPAAPAVARAVATPGEDTAVLSGAGVALRATQAVLELLDEAPVVVLSADTPQALRAAGPEAVRRGLPLLVDGEGAGLAETLTRLGTTGVLTVGTVTVPAGVEVLAEMAPAPTASTAPAAPTAAPSASASAAPLPAPAPAPPLPSELPTAPAADSEVGGTPVGPPEDASEAVVLSPPGDPASYAAVATARALGATVVLAADPREPAARELLADRSGSKLVGLGSTYGDTATARYLLAAAAGPTLPGGGTRVFDSRYVALYGHPGAPTLGVLGEQDVAATVARTAQVAGSYEGLSDPAVVPAMEIIATVAAGQAGSDGNFSNEASLATLTPLVDAAGAAGMYVLLDLQPGRSDFLSQAKLYQPLLERPYVGLALDPEWRLRPDERPLQQIGSVSAEEVNTVVTWLADLTREKALPQKMLLLHQFRLSMLRDRELIDTSRPELAMAIQMDGQGGQGVKLETWAAIRRGAPEAIRFGWKNFYDEDTPTLSPERTMALDPVPWFVSYQ